MSTQPQQINTNFKETIENFYGFLILSAIVISLASLLSFDWFYLASNVFVLIVLIVLYPLLRKYLNSLAEIPVLSPWTKYLFLLIGIIYLIDAIVAFLRHSIILGIVYVLLGLVAIFATNLAKELSSLTLKSLQPVFTSIEESLFKEMRGE